MAGKNTTITGVKLKNLVDIAPPITPRRLAQQPIGPKIMSQRIKAARQKHPILSLKRPAFTSSSALCLKLYKTAFFLSLYRWT